MIVVKPKIGTLFSVGVFIAASLSLGGYSGQLIISRLSAEWYHYLLAVLFAPLGLGLLLRMVLNYKIVKIGKGSVSVHFPVRRKNTTYKLSELVHWKETAVNTMSGKYREVKLLFEDRKTLDISMQEHNHYSKAIDYLKKKAAKKKK